MLYEIRNYHFKPELFDAYKADQLQPLLAQHGIDTDSAQASADPYSFLPSWLQTR